MHYILRLRDLLDGRLHPRRWMAFLLAFMLVRGLLLLCVLPALEGWDEFQHLGYVDYLDRHGAAPIAGKALLDRNFTAAMFAYPQGPYVNQRLYANYWRSPGPAAPPLPVDGPLLYEAQHPPGYYWLMLPIYRAEGGLSQWLAVAFTLRLLDLGFTIAAAGIFMASFRLMLGPGLVWRWAAALLAVHPLFLLTGDRVANDALSLLMGSLAWYLAVRLMDLMRRGAAPWRNAVFLGVALGIATWTKPTILAICPVAVLAPMLAGWQRKTALRAGPRLAAMALVVLIFALIAGPYFLHNLRLYHAAVPIFEAVYAGKPATAADFLHAIANIHWTEQLRYWWLNGSLWVGGWSFLRLPDRFYYHRFEPLMALGLVLALARAALAVFRSRTDRTTSAIGMSMAACVCFSLALAVHAVQTFIYVGEVHTCAWYAAGAWPLELLAVAAGFAFIPWRWIGKIGCGLLMLVCLQAEWQGTMHIMPQYYGDTTNLHLAFVRLASIRPRLFGTVTLHVLAVLYLVMAVLLFVTIAATSESLAASPDSEPSLLPAK